MGKDGLCHCNVTRKGGSLTHGCGVTREEPSHGANGKFMKGNKFSFKKKKEEGAAHEAKESKEFEKGEMEEESE